MTPDVICVFTLSKIMIQRIDGVNAICTSLDNNPEKIVIHMLEMLVKFRSEGLFDIVVEDE